MRAASETIGKAIAITGEADFSHLPGALELRRMAIRAGAELAKVTAVGKTRQIRACTLAAEVGRGLGDLVKRAGKSGATEKIALSPQFSEGELLVTVERACCRLQEFGRFDLSIVYVGRSFRAAGINIYIGPQHVDRRGDDDQWVTNIREFWRNDETEAPSILNLLPLFDGGSVFVHTHEEWTVATEVPRAATKEWTLFPAHVSLPRALSNLEKMLSVLRGYRPTLLPSGPPQIPSPPYVAALNAVRTWVAAANEAPRELHLTSPSDD
jgi:hypothetical protein